MKIPQSKHFELVKTICELIIKICEFFMDKDTQKVSVTDKAEVIKEEEEK